ncbi:MAG: metallophosphoesterase [Lentisphaerae bacterium]|nr:metallophosphoesterase [Lentisphaerota bacterium]
MFFFRLIFIFFPLFLFLLVVAGFLLPVCRAYNVGRRARAGLVVALLVCYSKFAFFLVLGGNDFNPDLPCALIWVWNWLYSGAMILACLMVVLCFVPARVKAWLLPSLAWTLAAWGVWNGVKVPHLHEIEVVCDGLPESLDGYRIVQIADIHVSSAAQRWRTEAVVAVANAANADLAVCTGDIVDGPVALRADDVAPLSGLKAKDGVWFVTGNHEFYGEALWREAFDRFGFTFLRNGCVFPREGLALGGLDDEAMCRLVYAGLPEPEPSEVFSDATNGEFRVLLQHRPEYFRDNVRFHGVGLQLSGHTHGGVMPGFAQLIALMNGGFVKGLYRHSAKDRSGWLYVSPGCGQWAGFPIRFFDDPEVSLLVLRHPRALPIL